MGTEMVVPDYPFLRRRMRNILQPWSAGTFDPGNNDVRFSIFGEEGVRRTENAVQLLENLSTAKQMTADGKDAKAIKQPRFISQNTIG